MVVTQACTGSMAPTLQSSPEWGEVLYKTDGLEYCLPADYSSKMCKNKTLVEIFVNCTHAKKFRNKVLTVL